MLAQEDWDVVRLPAITCHDESVVADTLLGPSAECVCALLPALDDQPAPSRRAADGTVEMSESEAERFLRARWVRID